MYLVILDGIGIRDEHSSENKNALKVSDTPNINRVFADNPSSELNCHGKYVGLPENRAGNSEVGHLTIGSGKRVDQPYKIVNNILEDRRPDRIVRIFRDIDCMHFIGLCSDGGVHSDIHHLTDIIEVAQDFDVQPIVHFISDGRDVKSGTAIDYARLLKQRDAEISTLVGRHYAMDRDDNMDRTKMTLDSFFGESELRFSRFEEAVEEHYSEGLTDQYIKPTDIKGVRDLRTSSNVMFFNFRDDRMKQLAGLVQKRVNGDLYSIIKYLDSDKIHNIVRRESVGTTLHDVLNENSIRDFRISESEKQPHVSWFFNGRKEVHEEELDMKVVSSPEDQRYSEVPGMRSSDITEMALDIDENLDKFCLINYANVDLVGHSGEFNATVRAVEEVDRQMGRLLNNIKSPIIFTSDHGNIEEMGSEEKPDRSHTSNPVPMAVVNYECSLSDGELADIAPTILDILDIEGNPFDGSSLIDK